MASVLLLTISCKNDPTTQKNAYSETTQKLVDLVENDSQLKSLLTEAIEKGKKINPDPKTNPVQSLEACVRMGAVRVCTPCPEHLTELMQRELLSEPPAALKK